MHSHYYLGKTTINDRHWHSYEGTTSCDPNEPGHVHHMDGKTSFDDGHVHEYRDVTGPAIYVGGKHYHMYCAVTKAADGHVHKYEDATHKYYDEYFEKCSPCKDPCK